jgi:DNA modification methylase
VTSPPYLGLRDYNTAEWEGGDPACDHQPPRCQGESGQRADRTFTAVRAYRDVCGKCGARRIDRQIGLEPTVAEYVAALVAVFREVRRVLRDDGTLWLNLGDAYANDAKWGGATGGKHAEGVHGATGIGRQKVSTGYPPKCLLGLPWRVAFALIDDGWILRSDCIWHKCLSGGATLYAKTQKGVMPMMVTDLVRLRPETVQLWNGERWTRCVAWSETPRPDNPIEIELRSGERIGCTPNHIWPTQRGNVRADELTIGDVIQTTTLPDTDNLGAPALPQSVAWVVGLFVAEGSRDGEHGVRFSLNADEQGWVSDLRRFAQFYGATCREHRYGNNLVVICEGRVLRAVIDTYVAGNRSKGKHLTTAAWQRDNGFLRDLLAGYLAGDGHLDVKNQRWRIGFTANDALAQDIRTLGARVGATVRLRRVTHTCKDKSHPGWRGEVRLERGSHFNNKQQGEIVALRVSRARRFYDISVEDDPHLFALASGVLTHNSNPMPESVTDRPTRSHEYIFLLAKQARYYYDADAIREPMAGEARIRHEAALGMTNELGFKRAGSRNDVSGGMTHAQVGARAALLERGGRNRRDVWTVATQPTPFAHFATFPQALIEPCILAGAPAGGVVLDPFAGSGTTGVVAQKHGRRFVGIELNPDYCALARERLQQIALPLSGEEAAG